LKIRVTKIGKPSFNEAQSWVDIYTSRLGGFCQIEFEVVKDSVDEVKLMDQIQSKGGFVVALDERGKDLKSEALAKNIQNWTDNPQIKSLNFIIGGPYGLTKETRNKANYLWSLSSLTLQGDLAWLIASEQIYRAFNIIKGTGYHHV
jgi:23S rRNA (pseudouridine1915-N3)-methyltransferase